jgi:hypothetical protein
MKHPNTELEIRQGKRKQNFVVCPDCKPEAAAAPAAAKPATAEKKNGDAPENGSGKERRWFDRQIFG